MIPLNTLLLLIRPTTLETTDNSMTKKPGKYQNISVNVIETASRNDNTHKIPETIFILFTLIDVFLSVRY